MSGRELFAQYRGVPVESGRRVYRGDKLVYLLPHLPGSTRIEELRQAVGAILIDLVGHLGLDDRKTVAEMAYAMGLPFDMFVDLMTEAAGRILDGAA